MAGEYGVNIKFRAIGLSQIDKATAKAKELENSVSKIRSLDLGKAIRGPVGDRVAEATGQIKRYARQINKTGKVIGKTQLQQEAALEAFENLRKQVKVGGRDYDILTEAIKNQNLAIAKQNELNTKSNQIRKKQGMFPGLNQGFLGNLRKGALGGGALQSGLVSGAFPLLFGQGPLGGAAGFAGGFLGTKIGGQMGGFAGGLVATAVLQQITTLVTNINTLGNAFNQLNPNIEQLTISLGIAGTVEAERLKILEKSEGTHAALAAATEKMNQAIGEKGVKNLKEFAESSRLLGNEFKKAMAKFQAAMAPFFEFFAEKTGAKDRENARLATFTGDEQLLGMRSKLAILENTETSTRSASKKKQDAIKALKEEIKTREELLAKEGKSIELAQLRNDQFNLATKAIRNQNIDLKNQINLGTLGAEVEREKLRIAKEMKIPVSELTEDMLTQIDVGVRLRDQLQKQLELHKAIAGVIKEGITDAIMGAIEGTKTLGDVARQVFSQIARSLISSGVDNLTSRLNIPGFRAAGGPVKGGGSYIVGERGPELFTPKSSGMITPNNQLGGSTNVVVNVDAKGSSVEGDQGRSAELGRVISAAVQSEIVNQQRPGGLLA